MKAIREVIDNFSGGLNTLFSARDLINSQFQELKNFVIRVKGKITKVVSDRQEGSILSGISTVDSLSSGRGFHIYRTSKNIAKADVSTEFGVIYLKTANNSAHNIYRQSISPLSEVVDQLSSTFNDTFWTERTGVLPDFYSQNQILRISDGLFTNISNKSLWYGYIKRDIAGKGEDYTKSPAFINPSSIILNPDIDDWVLDYQKGDAPTIVKMTGFGDSEGNVTSVGQVGLFVYDPRTLIKRLDTTVKTFETDAWQEWGQAVEAPEGDTFSEEDRWTATFIYDHVYESELGRDILTSAEIGVSGFNTVESNAEIEDDEKVYKFSESDVMQETVTLTNIEPATNLFDIGKEGGSASAEAIEPFKIGDVIRLSDEYMKIYKIGSDSLYVYRGLFNSKIPDKHPIGEKIYRVRARQSARAVNLVLYTGSDIDSGFNKRITAVRLYWNPKNEVDWYLVEHYDINEGATMNKVSPKFPVAQSNGSSYGFYGSKEYKDFFSDTSKWMLCPDKISTERLSGAPQAIASSKNSGTHLLKDSGDPYNNVVAGDYVFSTPEFFVDTGDYGVLNGDSFIRNAICANISHVTNPVDTEFIYNGASVFVEENTTSDNDYFPSIVFAADSGSGATITFSDADSNGNLTEDPNINDPSELGFQADQRLHICPVEGNAALDSNANLGMYIIKSVSATKITIKMSSELSAEEIASGIKSDFTAQALDGGHNQVTMYLIAETGVNHYNYKYSNEIDNDYMTTDDVLNTEPLIQDSIGEDDGGQRTLCIYPKRNDAITTMYVPYYGDKDLTYASLTGRSESTRIRNVRWKCSTIVNNVAVIGNIKTKDINDQDIAKDDRIMWSKQGAHDDFTLIRSKDVSIIDSGEITNLVTFGQYVYVVKTNAVYVLDSMQNFRAVGSYSGIGSNYYGGAISTPYGVVVANEVKVVMLPDNVELSEIIKDSYQDTTFTNPTLSFNSKTNELRIVPQTTEVLCYEFIYNFTDKAWCQRHKAADDHSNYLPAFNGGEYYILEIGGSFALREVETGSEKETDFAILHTKDFHFGDPSRQKYISDIFISYKSSRDFSFHLYIDGFSIWEKTLSAITNKQTKRLKVNRQGRVFSFKIESAMSRSDIEIDDIVIEGWHLDRH